MKHHKYLVWARGALALGLAFGAFLASGGASAQTPALVSVSPEYQLVRAGQEFSVQVRIDDVQALYGFDVLLSSVTLSDRDGLLIPCDIRSGAVRLGDYQLFLPAAFR